MTRNRTPKAALPPLPVKYAVLCLYTPSTGRPWWIYRMTVDTAPQARLAMRILQKRPLMGHDNYRIARVTLEQVEPKPKRRRRCTCVGFDHRYSCHLYKPTL